MLFTGLGRSVLGELKLCPRSEYRPRATASGGTQDLEHSFPQYGPPSRWITYKNKYVSTNIVEIT